MKKFYLASVFVLVCFFGRAQQPFVTTWEVTASDLTIEIPTTGTGYNFTIDFGDGTVQNNVTGDTTHTYSSPGTYTVSISGNFPRIYFPEDITGYNPGHLSSIEQWGDIQWQSMEDAFSGCNGLVINATDAPDLSQVTDMSGMFKYATNFNQSINHWDVSNITDMSEMFMNTYYFNQPLDNWDVSNVTDMSGMFKQTTSFNQSLNNWDVSSVTNMSGMFAGSVYNQPISNWDVSGVTDMSKMFADTPYNQSLSNWNVSNVTDMSHMFLNAINFNQNINVWDVSSVTNMEGMFRNSFAFNQPLNNWNVSSVTNMSQMFYFEGYAYNMSQYSFDQPINSWDVSNVTNMSSMFSGVAWGPNNFYNPFNQALNNWDVSSVVNMSRMFLNAKNFNQNINSWDVSNVTDMEFMFGDTDLYNQPLNNWDVSNVTEMSGMFQGAISFNQSLNNWDVSNVVNMSDMFFEALSFNGTINNWDVSSVTDMSYMFRNADAFNQPLNNWDVSNVMNMNYMFNDADLFNQPLNNWDVSMVMDITSMFYYAQNFNQDLSSWYFNNGDLTAFISGSGMDVVNYDAFLSNLATLDINGYLILGATGLEYCNQGARDELVNNLNWIIVGDNLSPNCNTITGIIPYDENNNGCDPNDIGTDGIMVNIDDGTYNFSTFTNNGNYSTGVAGNTFTVSVTNLPPYYTATPASATVNFTSSNTQQQDFCLTANQSIEDLNVTLLPVSEARPGFEADYQLVVENVGTQTVANATATLSFDDTMQSFVSSTPAPTSSTANQLTFDLANLQPFETRKIDLVMQTFTPPTVNGGDVLDFTAIVTPNTNDNTPTDNTFVFAQTVVNSFDPNDKQVLQGDKISISQKDEYLDYLIRFQNTGTASAINVRILDTLHPKLDYSTIQPVSASHAYHVEITDGNHVEFIFENINLPHEAADEPGSHGFVAYKIKPKSNVQIGDFITGDARIYFDFNAPIITNTVSTEIVNLGIDEHTSLANQIIVYPNPAGDELKIHLTDGVVLEGVKIYNIQGRELQSFQGNGQTFNVSNLESGMYFLEIETNRGTVNRRLIKE